MKGIIEKIRSFFSQSSRDLLVTKSTLRKVFNNCAKFKSGRKHNKSQKLYYDNEATIFYSFNIKLSVAAKYIDIKYYIVKKYVQYQTIKFKHVITANAYELRSLEDLYLVCS